MKRQILLSTCLVVMYSLTSAQTSTERHYIKGGIHAWDNFMKEIYRYPSFEAGIVEYKDGKRYKGTMNYNKVLGVIQFIDEKGDTLAMSNEEQISSIHIGKDVYIYAPPCLLAVKAEGKAWLYKNERVRIADKQKTGGYGIPNTAGTIDAITQIDTRVNYNQIEMNESLLISRVTTYYIENQSGQIFPASKKNVLNMYPKHEDKIREYVKTYGVDFSREDHLLDLTEFLAKL